ncbi:MAG TPA: hypothetical protein VM198_01635 [Longimicrobiales bacterium]|nr:hypothetical protein [Longimicrobiales bacterium]
MTRANLVAGLLLLVMFLAGLTSGIVIQQLVTPRAALPAGLRGPFPGGMGARPDPGPRPGRFDAGILARRLDLSNEQEQAVDGIIREQQQRMDSLLISIQPNIEREFQTLSERISEILTPGQRADFELFVEEGFARLGARRSLPPPGDRPPFPMRR